MQLPVFRGLVGGWLFWHPEQLSQRLSGQHWCLIYRKSWRFIPGAWSHHSDKARPWRVEFAWTGLDARRTQRIAALEELRPGPPRPAVCKWASRWASWACPQYDPQSLKTGSTAKETTLRIMAFQSFWSKKDAQFRRALTQTSLFSHWRPDQTSLKHDMSGCSFHGPSHG